MEVVIGADFVVEVGVFTNIGDVELKHEVDNFVDIGVNSDEFAFDQVALSDFNPLPAFFLVDLVRINQVHVVVRS